MGYLNKKRQIKSYKTLTNLVAVWEGTDLWMKRLEGY